MVAGTLSRYFGLRFLTTAILVFVGVILQLVECKRTQSVLKFLSDALCMK